MPWNVSMVVLRLATKSDEKAYTATPPLIHIWQTTHIWGATWLPSTMVSFLNDKGSREGRPCELGCWHLPVCEGNWAGNVDPQVAQARYIKSLGPVVQKPIIFNPRLKTNLGVYFSTPKCCSTLIFGKTLHKKSILKNKNKQKKLLPKSWNMKQKFTLILD